MDSRKILAVMESKAPYSTLFEALAKELEVPALVAPHEDYSECAYFQLLNGCIVVGQLTTGQPCYTVIPHEGSTVQEAYSTGHQFYVCQMVADIHSIM